MTQQEAMNIRKVHLSHVAIQKRKSQKFLRNLSLVLTARFLVLIDITVLYAAQTNFGCRLDSGCKVINMPNQETQSFPHARHRGRRC